MVQPVKAASDRWSPDPDFGGRAVHVLEFDRPRSGADEPLTAQAIALMQQLAERDARSPELRAAAIDVIDYLPAGKSKSSKEIADAIFRFAQRTVAYEHEDEMHTPFTDFADFLYDQTLISPAALLSMPHPEGDCVDFSMLVKALCILFGIPAAYKTIAADPASPAYSHVYVIAEIAPGRRYALDASNGPGPGYEFALPRGKKSKLWPDPERQSMISNALYRRRRGRLGDDSTDSTDSIDLGSYSPGLDTNPLAPILPTIAPYSPPPSAPAAGGAWGSPSGPAPAAPSGSSGVASLFTTIANDATGILKPIITQNTVKAPYYIQGANGAQVLYNPSTNSIVGASGLNVGSLTAGGGGSLLLILALAAAAAIFSGHR